MAPASAELAAHIRLQLSQHPMYSCRHRSPLEIPLPPHRYWELGRKLEVVDQQDMARTCCRQATLISAMQTSFFQQHGDHVSARLCRPVRRACPVLAVVPVPSPSWYLRG